MDGHTRRAGGWALLAVALFCAVYFGFDLGERRISSPDEGRYIEIPREMALSNDYVLPRLNGVLYFEKPPLFYWLQALTLEVLPINGWTMRLWPALLGLGGCLFACWAGLRFYGRTAGIVAAGILATTLLYYGLARFVVLDMAVTAFMNAALFFYLFAAEAADERKSKNFVRWGHAAAAGAVLCKGLIGLVLPALAVLVWIILLGRWSFVKRLFDPIALAIFIVLSVPWHVAAAMGNKDFLWFYFVHEHLLRFTTRVHHRYGPPYYFLPVLIAGFLPWTGYIWHGLREAWPKRWSQRQDHAVELFLIIWVAVIFGFFSISDSKLPPYILPVFAPLAVLTGRLLAPYIDDARPDDLPVGRFFFIGLFGLVAIAVPIASQVPALRAIPAVRLYWMDIRLWVFATAAIFGAGALGAYFLPQRFGARGTLASIFLTALLGWSVVSVIGARISPNSVGKLSDAIRPYMDDNTVVASYDTFFYDLPVDLDRKVIVVDNMAEFGFGATQEDISSIVMSYGEYWHLWTSKRHVLMLARRARYDSWEKEGFPSISFCVIAETDRAVAFANWDVKDAQGVSQCIRKIKAGPHDLAE